MKKQSPFSINKTVIRELTKEETDKVAGGTSATPVQCEPLQSVAEGCATGHNSPVRCIH